MREFGFIALQIFSVSLAFFIGYVVRRYRGKKIDLDTLTEIILYVGTPCLAFSTIAKTHYNLNELGLLSGAMIFLVAGMALFLLLGSFFIRKPVSNVFSVATMYMNTANVGFPVTLFVLGQEAFAKAIILDLTMIVLIFSMGVGLMSKTFNAWLRLPVIYSAAVGLMVSFGWIQMPEFIIKPCALLGSLTVPVMIVSLGCKIADLQGRFSLRLPLLATVLRSGGGFLLGLLFVTLFKLQGLTAAVIILYSVLPAPIMAYILAQKYHQDEKTAAQIVFVSNLSALAVLPLVLYFIQASYL